MDNKKSNGHAAATVTALLEISNAVHSSENLSELFEKIHHTLKRIIDVSNFFIAIVDTKERTLHIMSIPWMMIFLRSQTSILAIH